MQTFKTAVVVVLLLGVCYGAYVALNAPEPTLPESLKDWNEDALALDVESGASVDIPQLTQTPPPGGLDSLAPPTVTTPPAGPATPSLSLPSTPAVPGDTSKLDNPSQPPATLTPPSLGGSEVAASTADNSIPPLPDLPSLGAVKEGDSVPLPGAADSGTLVPPPLSSSSSNNPTTSDSTPALALPSGPSNTDSPPASGALLAGNFPPAPATPTAGTLTSTVGVSSPGLTSAASSKPASATAQPFAQAREQALKLANEGRLREALAMMSPYYNHLELTHDEHLDLKNLLDALAGEVIYSRRHLLEGKFVVSPGDTLESIANKYRVSPEALANINGMGDSKVVLAGTEMKVLNGPFRCEVAVTKGELTLFLGDLYAGSFPVSIGKEPSPVEGTYSIVERRRDRSYVGPDSKFIAANDPRNPFGGYWMHLGNHLSIHGSSEQSTDESAGCISLAPLDAKEVYTLLTQGSEVVIKR